MQLLESIKPYKNNFTDDVISTASRKLPLICSLFLHCAAALLILPVFEEKKAVIIQAPKIFSVYVVSDTKTDTPKSAEVYRAPQKQAPSIQPPIKTKQPVAKQLTKQNIAPVSKADFQEQKEFTPTTESNSTATSHSSINNSYTNLIASKLEANKSYIKMYRAPNGVKDQVLLQIKLNKDGSLSSYEVIEYSKHLFFDKAATKIVQISSPFPEPPLELKDSLEFIVPILFDTT